MKRAQVIQGLAPSLQEVKKPLDPGVAIARRQKGLRGDFMLDPNSSMPGSLREAAVLVPIVDYQTHLTVLLTQRTAQLARHAGQVAFPGGRIETSDTDIVETALRETHEEIGLPRESVEVVGRLDDYVTGTGFVVAPIVGLLSPPENLKPDPSEVDAVFEVPLTFFMNPDNHKRESRVWDGVERHFYVMSYEDRYIWGATAAMLVNLHDVLMQQVAA